MKNFIKSVLSGSGEGLSSKRVVLFVLVALFIFEVSQWYLFHIPPNETLGTQLFTMLLAALATVFGEPFMDSLKIKSDKPKD